MIVGFFDSWLGGQRVMEEFQIEHPDDICILHMDRANAPYGGRTGDEIRSLTHAWVQHLWNQGAEVVILACNTASVHALRWLQQDIYPDRHILGVTVPWAEAVVEWWYKKIWVLATEATVRTRMYRERVHILDESVHVEEVAAPWLVPLIEQGTISWDEIDILLRWYLGKFSPDIEALVLGCTHYPIVQHHIERMWIEVHQKNTPNLIDPGREAAKKFRGWKAKKIWFF
jgi:glutamate racemase